MVQREEHQFSRFMRDVVGLTHVHTHTHTNTQRDARIAHACSSLAQENTGTCVRMCVDVHSPPPPPPPPIIASYAFTTLLANLSSSPSPSALGPALSLALHTCTHADKRARSRSHNASRLAPFSQRVLLLASRSLSCAY